MVRIPAGNTVFLAEMFPLRCIVRRCQNEQFISKLGYIDVTPLNDVLSNHSYSAEIKNTRNSYSHNPVRMLFCVLLVDAAAN
jgi:hypothetical protein